MFFKISSAMKPLLCSSILLISCSNPVEKDEIIENCDPSKYGVSVHKLESHIGFAKPGSITLKNRANTSNDFTPLAFTFEIQFDRLLNTGQSVKINSPSSVIDADLHPILVRGEASGGTVSMNCFTTGKYICEAWKTTGMDPDANIKIEYIDDAPQSPPERLAITEIRFTFASCQP